MYESGCQPASASPRSACRRRVFVDLFIVLLVSKKRQNYFFEKFFPGHRKFYRRARARDLEYNIAGGIGRALAGRIGFCRYALRPTAFNLLCKAERGASRSRKIQLNIFIVPECIKNARRETTAHPKEVIRNRRYCCCCCSPFCPSNEMELYIYI